jgi:flavin-binding protein dodecin
MGSLTVAKIIEIVGSSEKGWSEAAQEALDEAKKTLAIKLSVVTEHTMIE